jgi:hypothetical protein
VRHERDVRLERLVRVLPGGDDVRFGVRVVDDDSDIQLRRNGRLQSESRIHVPWGLRVRGVRMRDELHVGGAVRARVCVHGDDLRARFRERHPMHRGLSVRERGVRPQCLLPDAMPDVSIMHVAGHVLPAAIARDGSRRL